MAETTNSPATESTTVPVEVPVTEPTVDVSKHVQVDKKDFVKGVISQVIPHVLPKYGKQDAPLSKVEQILHAALEGYEIFKKLKTK